MLEFIYLYFFILIVQFSNHVNAITCSANKCFDVKISSCNDILPNYTGVNTQGICVSDRENSIIQYCAKNSNLICMNSSKTMCILLNSNPNDAFIGSYMDNNQNFICIQQTDIQLKSINPSSKDNYN
ncbi:hypothetical protein TTHERM_001619819 (macronuclear) [Tetrahymena thermophila SB210]|uniref:Transmembrane protein n=1 Tax=Tetrahymena thermophila (strain SB210) TaxID=312017 RepID=W7X071_TETTS|nr:hypothetical protein TTHERM_001619819 [Tetrahymena thermophila SB210]EWS72500.1 hypothetical protein TTHERM_001619819 [Tetrahymena thermophila SB210]|eukprot:XP_012654965.1 hypothetical protein TTHERM_001619819 [Tetrahymena thermophila SB210]